MFKRKKDGGFTLIELMIVIAVIGILAVVMVPKLGGVKTSAKNTGVVTNHRSVTATIQAEIPHYDSPTEVKTDIENKLVNDNDNKIKNPVNSSYNAIAFLTEVPTWGTSYTGKVVVVSTGTDTPASLTKVTVYACDDKGQPIGNLETVIKP